MKGKEKKSEPIEVEIIDEHPKSRICPECQREFKVKHLLRKFCTNHCKDRFNNRIKQKQVIAAEVEMEKQVVEEIQHKTNEETITTLEKNILTVRDMMNGRNKAELYVVEMMRRGYDFKVYEARFPGPKGMNMFYTVLGEFHMTISKPELMFVIKNQ